MITIYQVRMAGADIEGLGDIDYLQFTSYPFQLVVDDGDATFTHSITSLNHLLWILTGSTEADADMGRYTDLEEWEIVELRIPTEPGDAPGDPAFIPGITLAYYPFFSSVPGNSGYNHKAIGVIDQDGPGCVRMDISEVPDFSGEV